MKVKKLEILEKQDRRPQYLGDKQIEGAMDVWIGRAIDGQID